MYCPQTSMEFVWLVSFTAHILYCYGEIYTYKCYWLSPAEPCLRYTLQFQRTDFQFFWGALIYSVRIYLNVQRIQLAFLSTHV
jgi:hypothetical protein